MIRGDHMEELRIVPVNPNDADFLFRIMNNEVILARLHEIPTTFEDWCDAIRIWDGDADEENYIIWSCEKPIGWFSFNNLQSIDRIAYLKMAVILPEYQNKGIGTYALTHLIAQMRERRYNSIMLFTDKDNVTAQKCYQKCGFDVCEELVETMSDNTNVERYKMVCKF